MNEHDDNPNVDTAWLSQEAREDMDWVFAQHDATARERVDALEFMELHRAANREWLEAFDESEEQQDAEDRANDAHQAIISIMNRINRRRIEARESTPEA